MSLVTTISTTVDDNELRDFLNAIGEMPRYCKPARKSEDEEANLVRIARWYFKPIDELAEELGRPHIPNLENRALVKAAVHHLAYSNPFLEEYVRFFEGVNPDTSARYLAAALLEPQLRSSVKKIFGFYGPTRGTTDALMGATKDPRKIQYAVEILGSYGFSSETKSIVSGMAADSRRDRETLNLIKAYGPHKETILPLLDIMRSYNSETMIMAEDVLIGFGHEGLSLALGFDITADASYSMQRVISEVKKARVEN